MLAFIKSSIVRYFNAIVLSSIVVGLAIFTVVIGVYNYKVAMAELNKKATNIAELASIALKEPLWNYDEAGMKDIFKASLLDKDNMGVRVLKTGEDKASAELISELAGKDVTFDDLLKNSNYVENTAKVIREEKEIARVQIVTTTATVKAAVRQTAMLVALFALIFVGVISAFIVYEGRHVIQMPINNLKDSADHLAAGELNYEIDTNRPDELGSLAQSFDKMRNAIRKKLADLAILNSTGETMAGIHDQTEALETAIKVMNEQTRVERGSIYLVDQNKDLVLSAYYPEVKSDSHVSKTFKMSEGILGKSASSAKVIYVPDISKYPDFVATASKDNPKALLCVPMMDDKEVFGVMNFIGEVGKVDFQPEDEGFALTIARMTVITIKNIQMLEVIEEQNRNLEQRVKERTAELRQKTNDINNMLQNMRQGIFTIVPGATIHPEFSAYLSQIFETNQIANEKVFPFLFDQSDVGGDVLNQMEATFDSLLGEDAMNFEFNSHLLIHEYTKSFSDGRKKILELDWNAVLDSNDLIDKLMVTVRDVTELKALQLETEKQKQELDVIGQILSVSKDKFLEFIKSSYEFMDENKALIEKNSEKNLDVVATLFRNMHTIKGNARTYGLTYITDRVHEAESTYDRNRKEEDFPWDQTQLLEQLQAARDCIARYEKVFKDKLAGFGESEGSGISPEVLEDIAKAVEEVNEMSRETVHNSFEVIRHTINNLRYDSVQDTLKGIVAAVPSIAKQLDKETPDIVINDNFVRMKKEIVPVLRNIFMHVFRNSMDHGLESTEQRVAKGKPTHGKIKLDVALDADQVVFEFQDDGKGLALGAILNKALANGQATADQKLTDEQIAEFIFLSGLSTATEVTNVSGRGVGMDAIRNFLKKYQGDVQIVFTGPSVTEGFRPFKQVITLPAKFAVKSH